MNKARYLPALLVGSLGLLILTLSAGCSAFSLPDLPTPYPTEYLPTVLAMTIEAGRFEATASHQPTATRTEITLKTSSQPATATHRAVITPDSPIPSRTPRTPLPTLTRTRFPSKTPTFTPTPSIPQAEIQFNSPGPMSKVISPLDMNVTYRSSPGGYMLIELLAEPLNNGQAGRLLVSKLLRFASGEPLWLSYLEALSFEISRVSEFSVLRLSVFDSFQRPIAVTSLDLLLLSVGSNELNPSGNQLQPVVIFEPTKNKLIQGNMLTVSGMTRPEGDQILHFELVTQDRRVVGMHDLFTTPSIDGKHVAFSTSINYTVTKATWVRLTAYYLDPRIPGYRQLVSVPVLLSP